MPPLETYGWNQEVAQNWDELSMSDCVPARVIADFGSVLKVVTPETHNAETSGRLTYLLEHDELPKVGDWVAVRLHGDDTGMIEAVLPRHGIISRKAAGEKMEQQVIAANIDIAFIVQALDHDFSPERMQRYLYQLTAGGVQPVLVFNKTDQVDDTAPFIADIESLQTPYILTSATTGQNVDQLLAHIKPGQTAVLLGSSGVGKSTLTNHLLGRAVQKTQEVREEDSKGRHTTTHRELFVLEGGGLLIDTPGMRELQLWGTEEELQDTFDDITALALTCQFRNCGHTSEAGCAINAALADGTLDRARYDNYLRMKKELAYLQAKSDPSIARAKKQEIAKQLKQHYKAQKQSPKNQ